MPSLQSEEASLSVSSKLKDSTSGYDLESALDLLLDPISGSPARNKKVEGHINIHVDDLLPTVLRNLHDVDMTIPLKLCLVSFAIPSDFMDMIRRNA